MINLTWLVYYYLRVKSGLLDQYIEPELITPGLVIYFYWFIIFLFVGLYRTWFAASRFDELSALFKAAFFGTFLLFFIIFMDDTSKRESTVNNRLLIFIYWAFFLFSVGAGRLMVRSLQKRLIIKGFGRKNALIVGFNQRANSLHEQISRHRALGLDIIAYVAQKPENIGKEFKGVKVLDSVDSITQTIDNYNVQEIIIALDKNQEDTILEIISKCDSKNVNIKILADLYEIISGQAKTSHIYGFPLIDIMPELMPEWEKKVKRLMDICISLLILLVSLPVTLVVSVLIKLDSPGTVLYKQKRAGLNGKEFDIYKFRSMRNDAEKSTGPVWSQKNDPRITRVGKFIRKVRIDEIPQMINVLKGEMSLVGPRPERPYFVEKLAQEIPLYKKRLKVRPGVTGWAQVKHKYDETIEDVKTKLRYDLFYIENMSLRMDFKILFRTVFVVLFGKGHYE
ncbi:MAG: undecaprenyl-phosphate glucose phosphotransferase [Ignavibacteria bacterium]|nr:undecaprenyl-phosphate glucose phosphotransferase [Ignavibacteria bacterium]MCU7503119.1 undecaprenyl-phosphate glucose phosphotransferase [Ignavibacteria bacterium]MCU7518425.1 undecaprenyl-phosphate glucose phosphotransferase [Ignavibacteria bacterium]